MLTKKVTKIRGHVQDWTAYTWSSARRLSETAGKAGGSSVAAGGGGAVDGVGDNSDGSLKGGGGVALLILVVIVVLLIIIVRAGAGTVAGARAAVAALGALSNGSIVGALGLAALTADSDVDSGGRSRDGDSDGLVLADRVLGAVASGLAVITVSGTVAGAGGLGLSGTSALDSLGHGAGAGLGSSGGGLIGSAVALATIVGHLRASLGAGNSDGSLDGGLNGGGDDAGIGTSAEGEGDSLVSDNIGGDGGQAGGLRSLRGLVASSGGRVGTGAQGNIGSQGGSDGLAGDAASLSLADDRGRDGASLGDGADSGGEKDGVGDNVGGLVGLGELIQGGLVPGGAVGDGGSARGDGLDLGGQDSQGGEGIIGAVVSAEVHVAGVGVGVGHGGEHADVSDDRLHLGCCFGFAGILRRLQFRLCQRLDVFKTTAEVNSLVVSGEQDTVLLHERRYKVGMVKAGMCKDCNGKKAGKEWNESHKRLKECG